MAQLEHPPDPFGYTLSPKSNADLTLIQPLVAHIQRLTQRVTALEKQAAFEAEIAAGGAVAAPPRGHLSHARAVGEFDAEAIERSEKVLRQIEYTVINIAALLGSLYSSRTTWGVRSIA